MEPFHFNINNFNENVVLISKSIIFSICRFIVSIFSAKNKLFEENPVVNEESEQI